MSEGLRLLVEDEEDLKLISAAVQDAVGSLGDIRYERGARRLTLLLNRYRWEGGRRGERVRTAVQIGGVLGVQARRLKLGAGSAVVSLLSIGFEPGEAPGGQVVFRFAGDADLRAEVECVDALLADVSEPWPAKATPGHALD